MARLLMLTLLLFLFGFTVQADGSRQRPSLPVFKKSILLHRARLPVYGKLTFIGKPQHFKALGALPRSVALRLIDAHFEGHDVLKPIEDIDELRELGYKGNRTFLDQLYEIWGQKIRPSFIDDMNELEHKLNITRMQGVFEEFGIDPSMRAMVLADLNMLELVSDIIDTKWHRGDELGFEYHIYDASKFFAEIKKLEAADLAHWFERVYYSYQSGGGRACHSAHP